MDAWPAIVHGELVGLAKRRAALDAEEARWLREAEALRIWTEFGMVSLIDYLERVLGYAPRTGQHRLRVARALAHLPELTDALARGELSFSAVKELVRVATPATESAWREAARGKNIRELEELCAGHRPGDLPDDPAEPDARLHSVSFNDVTGAAYALFRQAEQRLTTDHGSRLAETDVLAALSSALLASGTGGEQTGRATYQLGYTVCRLCDRATQEGGGVSVPVTAAALEQARCFAQHIGDIDGNAPQRATQDIPPATVRAVWRRDNGVCQTPGCRSCVGLEIHHIIPRSDKDGTHELSNLTLRCFACHKARHDGKLRITGTAPDNIVAEYTVPFDQPLSPAPSALPSRYAVEVMRTEALSAIRGLGWSPAVAKSVVATALAELGTTATIETVLRAAIQRTPNSLFDLVPFYLSPENDGPPASTFTFAFNTVVVANTHLAMVLQYPFRRVRMENNVILATKAATLDALTGDTAGYVIENNIVFPQATPLSASNLVVDPELVGVSERDFHIRPESPAVDNAVPSTGLDSDMDVTGTPRPQGAASDIGAYELVQ